MTINSLIEAQQAYTSGLIGPLTYQKYAKYFSGPMKTPVPPVTAIQKDLMATTKKKSEHNIAKVLTAQAIANGVVPKHSGTAIMEPPVAISVCFNCKIPLCEVCTCCHTEGCQLEAQAITSKSQLVELNHLMAQTQKARGFVLLSKYLNVPKPFFVVTEQKDIEAIAPKLGNEYFVRPCPVRPRHGFVDSRSLKDGNPRIQLDAIYTEAQAADPKAELLITPTIAATHNLIMTPSRMAIGTGHDGATGGRGSISIPLMGVPFKELTKDIIKSAGVNEGEDPYIECVVKADAADVYHGNQPENCIFFTQLRAGVQIPANVGNDFVPERMIVKRVVEASGDLLEWERQAQHELGDVGTVVVHMGGTLISHYGVHCLFNKIPILTTRIPAINEVLVPTPKAEKPSLDAVRDGLIDGWGPHIGLKVDQDEVVKDVQVQLVTSNAIALTLVCLHNAAAMSGEYGYWIGIAATMMMRVGMAASHGESRHKDPSGKKYSREYVYKKALNAPEASRDTLGFAQWRFHNEQWSYSYGGPKWADCTEALINMDKAIRGFLKDPSETTLAKVVSTLNHAVTRAHNGGWWMNKFCSSQRVFEDGCNQSLYSLAAAAPAMLAIKRIEQKRSTEAIDRWRDLEDIMDVNPATLYAPKREESVPTAPISGCGDANCWDCHPPDAYVEQLKNQVAKAGQSKPSKVQVDHSIKSELQLSEKLAKTEPPPPVPSATKYMTINEMVEAYEKLELPVIGPKVIGPPPKPSHYAKSIIKPAIKHGNVNGITEVPVNPIVASAQARILQEGGKPYLHMQFTVKGVEGYYSSTFSYAVAEGSVLSTPTLDSMAKSGEMYFGLTHVANSTTPDLYGFAAGPVSFCLNVRTRQRVIYE